MHITNFINELDFISQDLILAKSNAFPWSTVLNSYEYLTFRTAPSHFPNNKSKIIILKRKIGEKSWILENSLKLNKDLREPRIVSLGNNKIFLYFCSLNKNFIFNPDSIMVSKRGLKGWTKAKKILKSSLMVYSVKKIGDVLYMTCYSKKHSSKCYFLKSNNGYDWEEAFPNKKIEDYLTCETDFIFKDGFFYFVSRNEFGKFNTYGSEIFKFSKDGNLVLHKHSDMKFDGPFIFQQKQSVYLVARKNLVNDGKFLLFTKPFSLFQYWISNLYYWLTPKKTAIWSLNLDNLFTNFVSDLPSSGDTSYASVVHINGKTKIYYYSNSGQNLKSWLIGEVKPTSIYSVELLEN